MRRAQLCTLLLSELVNGCTGDQPVQAGVNDVVFNDVIFINDMGIDLQFALVVIVNLKNGLYV